MANSIRRDAAEVGSEGDSSMPDAEDRHVRALHGVIEALNRRVEIFTRLYEGASRATGEAQAFAAEMSKRVCELEAALLMANEPRPEAPHYRH